MQNNAKAWWLASLTSLAGCLAGGEEMGGTSSDEELGALTQGLSENAVRTRVVGSNTDRGAPSDDDFGAALALSDDGLTMVVGAPDEDSRSVTEPDDDSLSEAGAAYVFARAARDAAWVQQAYLKASTPLTNSDFGDDVAISGDGKYVAVGAPMEGETGAVYVFRYDADGAGWVEDAHVHASRPHDHDYFGKSVALSTDGSTLAVGAQNEDELGPVYSGAAYVFRRAPSGWSEQAFLKASNAGNDDHFGNEVALDGSGNLLAVAAYSEASGAVGVDGNADEDHLHVAAGAVYVFKFESAADGSGFVWQQRSYIKASNTDVRTGGDRFGDSLALSSDGSTLAVGAPEEDSAARMINGNQTNNGAASSGAAYVFRATASGSWTQEAYVKPSNTDPNDDFGRDVALSNDGTYLVVGADNEASSAVQPVGGNPFNNHGPYTGAAYVFARTGTEWAQHAYLKPAHMGRPAGPPQYFGRSVDMNGAGDAIAVGTGQCSTFAEGVFTFTDP